MKLFAFPGHIEPDILGLGAEQIPYGRTKAFGEVVFECEKRLLELTGCGEGRVAMFTATGSGSADAAVSGWGESLGRALIVNGGTFGQRFVDMYRYYGLPFSELPVGFGQDLDLDELRDIIARDRCGAVLMQHHETSSGQLFEIARAGAICRELGAALVVDGISSFLADPLDMRAMDVDALILSSHKGLCLPVGLSFLVMTSEFQERRTNRGRSFYFDPGANLASLERGQPLFSPAVTQVLQLRERLRRVAALSLGAVLASVREKALAFRHAIGDTFGALSADTPSSALTGFRIPGGCARLVRELAEQDIYIMPGGDPELIRVGHLGASTVDDHLELADQILSRTKQR